MQALQVELDIRRRGGGSTANEEGTGRAKIASCAIETAIQVPKNSNQSDTIDIPDARRIGEITLSWWVSGYSQNIANIAGMRTNQFTLEGHEIAISWREMHNGFYSDMLLDQAGRTDIAHAHAGHCIVWNVNDVNAPITQILSVLQKLGEFHASWWQHLCTHYKATFSQ